ncbi:unnamed protein product [Lampetra fluviatilis]
MNVEFNIATVSGPTDGEEQWRRAMSLRAGGVHRGDGDWKEEKEPRALKSCGTGTLHHAKFDSRQEPRQDLGATEVETCRWS